MQHHSSFLSHVVQMYACTHVYDSSTNENNFKQGGADMIAPTLYHRSLQPLTFDLLCNLILI